VIPDDEPLKVNRARLVAAMPARVELVGGFFCGTLLNPQANQASDVHAGLHGKKIYRLNWWPVDVHTLVVVSPDGEQYEYVQAAPAEPNQRHRWAFSGHHNSD
jgi:hypothetical protein